MEVEGGGVDRLAEGPGDPVPAEGPQDPPLQVLQRGAAGPRAPGVTHRGRRGVPGGRLDAGHAGERLCAAGRVRRSLCDLHTADAHTPQVSAGG